MWNKLVPTAFAVAPSRAFYWGGFCVFAAVALFYLWTEHRAHLLGVLPYLLFLACPVVHFVMHGRHGHGHAEGPRHESH